MEDDDSPLGDDEEEIIVYVDFEGMSGPNPFCDEKLELEMIGLDSENPMMCLNGKYYEGAYEDAVGTYMFFQDIDPVIEDTVFDKAASLEYVAKTKKILKMSRVFIKPRNEVLGDSNHPDCIPNMDTIKAAGVPPKYQEEALSLWEKMRNERLEALNEYLEKHRQREEKRQQGIELESESDEDNPFAMYKPTADKADEILSETKIDNDSVAEAANIDQNTLTIIDPGPSTSKDSVAWIDSTVADTLDNLAKRKPSVRSKDPGFIQILERRKPKRDKKKIRKKESKNTDYAETIESVLTASSQDCVSNSQVNTIDNNKHVGDRTVADVKNAECVMSISDDVHENREISMDQVNDGVDNMIIDDIQSLADDNSIQNFEKLVSPPVEILDKKIEKQKKREAKMNEISERLKKLAEMGP